MFYSAYLLIEAALTGVFLYSVLFLPPNGFTNVCASTALALAVLCCLNGISNLIYGVKEKYDIVTNRISYFQGARHRALNKKSLSSQNQQDGSYIAMVARSLLQAIQCVLGYAGIIALMTKGPILLFPYAHKVSFWPISMAAREAVHSIVQKMTNFIYESFGVKMSQRGHQMKNLSQASQDYMQAKMPWLESLWLYLSTNVEAKIGAKAYIMKYHDIVRPIWRDQDFRSVWIIVWLLCAVGVIILHRALIRRQNFSHLLALLSGALTAGFLNENSILRDIQSAEAAAYGTTNILRLESIAYRLGLLDMSCNCVERSIATLGVTTWVLIILITMMILPRVNDSSKLSERSSHPSVPIVSDKQQHNSNLHADRMAKDDDDYICETTGGKISTRKNRHKMGWPISENDAVMRN